MTANMFRVAGIFGFIFGIIVLFDDKVKPEITLQNNGIVAWLGLSLALVAIGVLEDIADSLTIMRKKDRG